MEGGRGIAARLVTMRIVLHDYSGHPCQVQLSRELARRGHTVHHCYSKQFQTPHGTLTPRDGDPRTFSCSAIDSGRTFPKDDLVRRRGHERKYGSLLMGRIRTVAPQLAVFANTPIDSLSRAVRGCRAAGIPSVIWMQDIYSEGIREGVGRKARWLGNLVGDIYARRERQLLAMADGIVPIAHGFLPYVRESGSLAVVEVIPNWAPLDEIEYRPLQPRSRVRFLYSGTLGHKHRPQLLLKLGQELEVQEGAELTVRSQGAAFEWLRTEATKRCLQRTRFEPLLPFAQFSEELQKVDVIVVILAGRAGSYSVPSKTLSALCAGRPVLLSVAPENPAAQVVMEIGAGLAFVPQDDEGFLGGARTLLADSPLRTRLGQAARQYAETAFDVRAIAEQFERLFSRVVDRTGLGK